MSLLEVGSLRSNISAKAGHTRRFVFFSIFALSLMGITALAAQFEPLQEVAIPGQELSINGSGFIGGEPVTFTVATVTPGGSLSTIDQVRGTAADVDGVVSLVWTVPDYLDLGTQLRLSLTGSTSGATATASIMLASAELEIIPPEYASICLDTLFGQSVEICAVLTEVCDSGSQPLPGREVLLFVSDEGCGVNVGQDPTQTGFTDADGMVCFSVSDLETIVEASRVTFRVRFQGEDEPAENEPPNSTCDPDGRRKFSIANDCLSIPVDLVCQQDVVDFSVVLGDSVDLYYVKSVDLDRDNYVDIVFTGELTEGLYVAYGAAGGVLESPIGYLGISQDAFDFGYINEDTLLDIVAVRGTTTYLLYNLGYRAFALDSIVNGSRRQSNATVPSVFAGYVDGDQYLDLVQGPNLLLLGEPGGETFTEVTLPFSFDAAAGCDFNNDGALDLVTLDDAGVTIYLNDGSANFTAAGSAAVAGASLVVPPTIGTADFNRDDNCDFAVVRPVSDTVEESVITVALGDGAGGIAATTTIPLAGIAYNVKTPDVNGDNLVDLAVANGTTGSLNIYYGDGTGSFSAYQLVDLGTEGNQTLTLASLDVDRDGNTDFVSGELGGGNLVVTTSDELDKPVLEDEMWVYGYSYVNVSVSNPDSLEISEETQTVAGSDYQELDVNEDGLLDERTLDYNLQLGEYTITVELEPDSPPEATYGAAIGIDGSQQATIFADYDNSSNTKRDTIPQATSLTFYYTVEEVSSIQPPNGFPVSLSRPLIDWSLQVESLPAGTIYHFQLDRYYDFRAPIFDEPDLTEPMFQPYQMLGDDSVFYWHYRYDDGSGWSEFSRTFALYITGLCCEGSSGNANGDAGGEVDIEDVTYLAGYLFNGYPPPGDPPGCEGAGNVDGEGEINIIDVTRLVDYLFFDGQEPALCP